jgi:hypothetical protein
MKILFAIFLILSCLACETEKEWTLRKNEQAQRVIDFVICKYYAETNVCFCWLPNSNGITYAPNEVCEYYEKEYHDFILGPGK